MDIFKNIKDFFLYRRRKAMNSMRKCHAKQTVQRRAGHSSERDSDYEGKQKLQSRTL